MSNRRRFDRVPFFSDVSVTALPDGPTIPARSLDISLGGVGLVTQVALAPGQTVALIFSLPNGSRQENGQRVLGQVVNLRADCDVNYVGVEFLEPLSHTGSPHLVNKFLKI